VKITILAVGKARAPEIALAEEYIKRLKADVTIKEITTAKTQKAEAEQILKAIRPKSFVILLDERGKDLSSRDFAAKFAAWQERGALTFLIGGAEGVTDEVRKRADFILGFGKLTWPHRLVRVMLLEQIYRAQQINSGHPYHRD
jgi:23S rRNA (pseudouridine1915-N3)-methyltransferase